MKFLQLYFKAQYQTLVIILILSFGFVHRSEINIVIFTTDINSLGILFFLFCFFFLVDGAHVLLVHSLLCVTVCYIS